MDNKRAWERVLAAVEAEARRAQALLTSQPNAEQADPSDTGVRVVVPEDWLLPTGVHASPALADMPPVPPELRGQIQALQDRIADLQRELAAALRDWRQPTPVVITGGPRIEPPIYVDRRL